MGFTEGLMIGAGGIVAIGYGLYQGALWIGGLLVERPQKTN